MKGFGKFCIWLGALSLIGALIGGHSGFGPAFWLALGIVLVFIAKQKEDVNRKIEAQTDLESKNQSVSTSQSGSVVQRQPRQDESIKSKVVETAQVSSNTNKDIPMTTKQKEAAMCLISFFGGYNNLETNDEANQIVFELSCQVAIYFGIHDFPAMLPGAMKRNSDPDKMIDTVMTIEDRQYRECLLLTCYDLANMSRNREALELIFNIANDMGYNEERFKTLIKQYSRE